MSCITFCSFGIRRADGVTIWPTGALQTLSQHIPFPAIFLPITFNLIITAATSGASVGTKPLRVTQLNSIQMYRELCGWERDWANSVYSVRACPLASVRLDTHDIWRALAVQVLGDLQTEQTKTDQEWNGESDTPRGTQRCRWARQSTWTIALREQTSRAQSWQTDSYCLALGQRCPLHCYADRTTPPKKPKPTRPADRPTVVLW